MAASRQDNPQPHATGTAASSARNGTTTKIPSTTTVYRGSGSSSIGFAPSGATRCERSVTVIVQPLTFASTNQAPGSRASGSKNFSLPPGSRPTTDLGRRKPVGVVTETPRGGTVRAMGTPRSIPAPAGAVPPDGDRYAAHALAVDALRTAYRAAPAGAPVRLAKRTSNLFRFRDRARGPALDVRRFDTVLSVDPQARVADVQGMVTYERLVDATLPHGLMPLVVPQLKTITLGGAVAGLGIESTSFRNGLPHESVRELEILTGDGRVVVARADNEHADLFHAFPNSYGTLGYALRLTIELEPVRPYVHVEHVKFATARECVAALTEACTGGRYDFVDGTVFSPDEQYLTLGSFVDEAPEVSDYTGMDVYYQSIPRRTEDYLTTHDYLWRWDTDWFWCSRAFGVQHPLVRRLLARPDPRSDGDRRVVALLQRHRGRASGRTPRRRPTATAAGTEVGSPVHRVDV